MAWLKLAASSARPAVLDLSPNSFVEFLKSRNISAFHIAFDANKSAFHFSHPEIFKPVAENWLADPLKDWDNHEAVFVRVSPQGVLQSATVQHTKRGAAAGGVRNWTYETVDGFLRDGLRLGKGMGAKNAVAGLWWGGGKGVMARNSGSGLSNGNDVAARRAVYESYGTFISALKGCYVTAEDVGTHVEDMAHIFSQTRHTTCIPEKFGGSGNPSIPTARGVVEAITTGFEELNMKLEGSTVGLIGLGNVGSYVARYLLDRGVGRIIATDADPSTVSRVQASLLASHPTARLEFHNTTSLEPLLQQNLDCLSPCATGGLLSSDSIPQIAEKTKLVAGAANNQLLDLATDGELLHKHGVSYLPDFVVNRMGIVNCSNEFAGTYANPLDDPLISTHFSAANPDSIPSVVRRLIRRSKEEGRSTQSIAQQLAEDKSRELNPIVGHRAFDIIKYIVEDGKSGDPRWIEWLKEREGSK